MASVTPRIRSNGEIRWRVQRRVNGRMHERTFSTEKAATAYASAPPPMVLSPVRKPAAERAPVHQSTTIGVRLALEEEADRLADEVAKALHRWRELSAQRAAVELALSNLPLTVPAP